MWEACICVAEEDDDDDDDDDDDAGHDDDDDDDDDENNDYGGDAGYPDAGSSDAGVDCLPPTLDDTERMRAAELYATYCAACHGANAEGTVLGPELLEEVAEEDDDEIVEVILEGDDDMPPIAIPAADALAITRYLVVLSSEQGFDLSERCEVE